jgi:DNA-binding NtrC family response regulator
MLNDGIQHKPDPVLNGNETVLVVDDFEWVRSLLNDALTRFGYSVICAEDGMDGLKKYAENKERIHVMLLDVVMPKLNGLELFKEINKLESNTKVLFMSGYNEIFDRGNQQDRIKCISKPFKIKALLKELREVLDN